MQKYDMDYATMVSMAPPAKKLKITREQKQESLKVTCNRGVDAVAKMMIE